MKNMDNLEKQQEDQVEYFTDRLPDEVFSTKKRLRKFYRKTVRDLEKQLILDTSNDFTKSTQLFDFKKLIVGMEKEGCDKQEIAASFYLLGAYAQLQYVGVILQAFSTLDLPLPDLGAIQFDPMNPFVTNQRIADAFHPIFLQEKDTLPEKVRNYQQACCAVELMHAFDYIKRQEEWMSVLYDDFYNDPKAREKTMNEMHKKDTLYNLSIESLINDEKFKFKESSNKKKLIKMAFIFYHMLGQIHNRSKKEMDNEISKFGFNFIF